jgi:hypothetical protein
MPDRPNLQPKWFLDNTAHFSFAVGHISGEGTLNADDEPTILRASVNVPAPNKSDIVLVAPPTPDGVIAFGGEAAAHVDDLLI